MILQVTPVFGFGSTALTGAKGRGYRLRHGNILFAIAMAVAMVLAWPASTALTERHRL